MKSGLPRFHDGSQERVMGCVMPTRDQAYHGTQFANEPALQLVPRSEWTEIDYSDWLPPVMDQGQTPECGGFSGACAATAVLRMSGRQIDTVLSPGWIYGYCREPGGGILVRNAMTCLQDRGCCEVDLVGPFDIISNNYSQAAKAAALENKVTHAVQVTDFDQVISALHYGWIVEFGIEIGSNFRPQAGGIIPPFAGSGGGHAMFAYGCRRINGQWYARVRNSWGSDWGDGGCCLMPESYFVHQRPGVPYINLDSFAIRSVRQDADQPE